MSKHIWSRETAELHMLQWDAAQRKELRDGNRQVYLFLGLLFFAVMALTLCICWFVNTPMWVAE
jgi:hypothetical protein